MSICHNICQGSKNTQKYICMNTLLNNGCVCVCVRIVLNGVNVILYYWTVLLRLRPNVVLHAKLFKKEKSTYQM